MDDANQSINTSESTSEEPMFEEGDKVFLKYPAKRMLGKYHTEYKNEQWTVMSIRKENSKYYYTIRSPSINDQLIELDLTEDSIKPIVKLKGLNKEEQKFNKLFNTLMSQLH